MGQLFHMLVVPPPPPQQLIPIKLHYLFCLKNDIILHQKALGIFQLCVKIKPIVTSRNKNHIMMNRSKMTLNYWVTVERYPHLNGVVGNSIPIMKSSLYLTAKTK
jgi:hypothetical protein